MRISDWSSDVCSSDLVGAVVQQVAGEGVAQHVGRYLGRVDLCVVGQLLQQLGNSVTGQMTLGAARGEQPGRGGLDRLWTLSARRQEVLAHRKVGAEIGRASGRERVCRYV